MIALDRLRLGTLAAFVALALSCAHALAQSAQPIPRPPSPALLQPPNVGDAKAAATAYHDSGEYGRDLAVVASEAGAWIAQRAPQVSRPALVLDIDDTALTNW